jgi:hypothetical protein
VDWLEETDLVISFLDRILLDVIESSPHITPVRTRNKRIKKFEELLSATYIFDDSERVYVDDNNLVWNVVEVSPQPCGDVDNEILDNYTQII